jgi:DNA-directed RNA polymerase subunit RPC12/RpoP
MTEPVLRPSTITLEKIKVYEANAGGECPHCGSDILEYDLGTHAGHVYEQKVDCMDCGNKWLDQYRFAQMVFTDDQTGKLPPELKAQLREESAPQWTVIGYYDDSGTPYSETFAAESPMVAATKAFAAAGNDSFRVVDVVEGFQASRLNNEYVAEKPEDLGPPESLGNDEDRTGRPPPDL